MVSGQYICTSRFSSGESGYRLCKRTKSFAFEGAFNGISRLSLPGFCSSRGETRESRRGKPANRHGRNCVHYIIVFSWSGNDDSETRVEKEKRLHAPRNLARMIFMRIVAISPSLFFSLFLSSYIDVVVDRLRPD